MAVDTRAPDAVTVGSERVLRAVENLTRTQIVQYAGAADDYNPLHTDEVYAREVAGAPTVFAHGMLSMALTGRLLAEWFGNERVVSFAVRFKKQVWPGDDLTVTGRVTSIEDGIAEVALSTVNQGGVEVVAGSAKVRLP
ncbi:MaoC/PaaZ C-terminal domain-containing protein [Streptomyces sp. NPDC050625]|uniref:MaoC/PaaZ C-terminal domain-containing protein n=1 Tax=Streptomyces sp. NPDC050625 TaxID=3154629 RepID=UPI0034489FFE